MTKSKKYPCNGPTIAEQAKVVYHWNSPWKAKRAFRDMKKLNRSIASAES